MRKFLALMLTAALCLTMLGSAVASSESTELTVWCWDPAFNLYAMQEAAKIYQKDHPDFKLNVIEVPWDDIQTRINTAATANDLSTLPDILLCQNNAFQKNTISYPELFVDLTDKGIAFDQFGAGAIGFSTVDGRNYGVPFDNGVAVMAIRTDILEEAGYTLADVTDITWEQFFEVGKAVLEKTGRPILSTTAGGQDVLHMLLQSVGSSFFTEDGMPYITNNDAIKETIETYVRLVKEGLLIEVNNWDEYISTFINGDVAATMNGCWILASVQTAADQSGKWSVTNIPSLSIEGATNYASQGGSSWGVISTSKNQDLAVDFLSKTFAGSVELYETILPSSGALANYAPAGESDVYAVPQPFFQDQAIYADIVEFSQHVPSFAPGVYYYEARNAIGNAITNIINGGDIDTELQLAEDEINFVMGY